VVPVASGFVVRRVMVDGAMVVLAVTGAADTARCPACGAVRGRVHSRYHRRPPDLPWRGHAVRLVLSARRFARANAACRRRTFVERFGDRLAWRARRTGAADALLLGLARAAGAEAGARRASAAGLPVGPDTLLRLERRAATATAPTPRVLGIDDVAWRRGQRDGLLRVDPATRRPVGMLPDAEPGTLAAWLRSHPGAQVIARDRGQRVVEGVAAGAPDATVVADRFHLVRDVHEALDALQRQRRRAGSPAFRAAAASPVAVAAPTPPVTAPAAPADAPAGEPRPSFRVGPARWERAHALRAAGSSLRGIARELGLARTTVRRLLERADAPRQEYERPRPVPRQVAPVLPHLQRRWAEGGRNGRQLTAEIAELGYAGSGSSVRWMIARWRPERSPPDQQRPRHTQHLRWLLLRPPERLTADEHADLARDLAADPDLAAGHALAKRFRDALRRRHLDAFEGWLAGAGSSGLAPFVGLAEGMRADRTAIRNASRWPWSTGPVEGHVNRLKLIKRRGYGRAKPDLLRSRIFAA
jgi:transposase